MWLLSGGIIIWRSIHIVACVSVVPTHSIVWLRPSPHLHSSAAEHLGYLGCWLLQIKLPWTSVYTSLYGNMLSFLLGKIPMGGICLIFKKTARLFPKWCIVYFRKQCVSVPVVSVAASPTLAKVGLFNFSGCLVVLHRGFHLYFC